MSRSWVAQQAARATATAPVVEGWKDGVLTVFCEGKPMNPQDGSERHYLKKAKTVKAWRERTANGVLRVLNQWGRPLGWPPEAPKRITFVIYSRRAFDDDNLTMVAKPSRDGLRDAGIIHDDARRSGHRFLYENVVAPKMSDVHGIAIRVGLRKDVTT